MKKSLEAKAAKASDSCDIAIVGGGMVGLSLALLLAHADDSLRITVLEAQPLAQGSEKERSSRDKKDAQYQPSFDARSTAISRDSADILQRIALWPALEENATAINKVHVSDRGHFGHASYSRDDNNGEALGFVVENAWLGRILIDAVQKAENIELRASVSVSELSMRKTGVQLELASEAGASDSQVLNARLLVAADGGDSRLRQRLGIFCDIHDYQQSAVIANIEFDTPHKGRAFERFTSAGPLALLPLADSPAGAKGSRMSLVWTHGKGKIDEVLTWSDEVFAQHLQATFGFRLGHITRVGERQHYPLRKMIAREQVRSSLVLMGNAAHYLHPVAGQGFNLALRDSQCLAMTISQAQQKQQDFSSLECLQTYLRSQESDQLSTIGVSHLFNTLFTTDRLGAAALRNLGLMGLNAAPPIKATFFQQMMGKDKKQLPRI